MKRRLEEFFADFMENYETEDSANVKSSTEQVLGYISNASDVNKTDVDDMLTGLGYEYEKQGFMNGFQYALRLQKGGALA